MNKARRGPWIRAVLMMAFALLAWRNAAAHHAVLRFNLEELVVTADRVFIGRCVEVTPATEEIGQGRMPVTHYTFEVDQVLKGELPARFSFTQLGHPPRAARKGEPSSHGQAVTRGITLHGAADFGVGDRLLLFLTPNHLNGRMTYPVGLDQGAFILDDDGSGEVLARNNMNNLGLFTAPYNNTRLSSEKAAVLHPEATNNRLAPGAQLSDAARDLESRRGALPLTPLVELIQQINGAHGGAKGVLRGGIGGRQ